MMVSIYTNPCQLFQLFQFIPKHHEIHMYISMASLILENFLAL